MNSFFKLILMVFMFSNVFGESGGNTSITTSVTLKVDDKKRAGTYLVKLAENRGGYFLNFSDHFIVFKIENKEVERFLNQCDSVGFVMDKNYASTDHTIEIIGKKAKLAAKRKLLSDYFALLNQAEMGSVLSVEKAIVGLQTEIESLMADLKLLEQRISMAEITVHFQFNDRKPPLRNGDSEFEWLNNLSLYDLHKDFQNGLK